MPDWRACPQPEARQYYKSSLDYGRINCRALLACRARLTSRRPDGPPAGRVAMAGAPGRVAGFIKCRAEPGALSERAPDYAGDLARRLFVPSEMEREIYVSGHRNTCRHASRSRVRTGGGRGALVCLTAYVNSTRAGRPATYRARFIWPTEAR